MNIIVDCLPTSIYVPSSFWTRCPPSCVFEPWQTGRVDALACTPRQWMLRAASLELGGERHPPIAYGAEAMEEISCFFRRICIQFQGKLTAMEFIVEGVRGNQPQETVSFHLCKDSSGTA